MCFFYHNVYDYSEIIVELPIRWPPYRVPGTSYLLADSMINNPFSGLNEQKILADRLNVSSIFRSTDVVHTYTDYQAIERSYLPCKPSMSSDCSARDDSRSKYTP